MPGMKSKTIKKVISAKIADFAASIEDPVIKEIVKTKTIVTGGCIASMLLGEPINDFDLYFRDLDAAQRIADYYVARFAKETGHSLSVVTEDGRVRVCVGAGYRGETAGNIETLSDSGEIEDRFQTAEGSALEAVDDGLPKYRPVFISTNAITLANKVQLIVRFYGEPDQIHENYDFAHCTNYWSSWDGAVVLRPAALEALLAKELRYVGSKYPVCSVIRLRKFIGRGWKVNAGQILKMLMQISALDLTDPKVLEDQLTGVDSAYFMQVMTALKEKDPQKVNAAYLIEIIDRMF